MVIVNTHHDVHSVNWRTGPRMILTILGAGDIVFSTRKIEDAKSKVGLKMAQK